MIYAAVGLPSRFCEWCESIFRALLAEAGEGAEILFAENLEQLGRELLGRRATSALVISREPKKKFSEAISASAIPVLLTLDDPSHAVSALVVDRNVHFPQAIGFVANTLTSVLPLSKARHALVLTASSNQTALEVATSIAGHFQLKLTKAAIRKAISSLPDRAPAPPDLSALPGLTDIVAALAARASICGDFGYDESDSCTPDQIQTAALAPMWALLSGDPLREIFWHPLLFRHGDRHAESAACPIDITGPRRCLSFGPYIQLPEGAWTCSMLLGCDKNAVGVVLTVDVFTGVELNSIDVEVTAPGLFEIAMSFVNSNPDALFEVRVRSTKPNFEGHILPGNVRLMPQRASQLRAS